MRVHASSSLKSSLLRSFSARCQHAVHRFLSRLPRRVPPVVMAVVAIQACWLSYDATVTSQRRHRPKRPPVRVTESSPLSPFYPPSPGQKEYNGFARTFPVWKHPYPCGPLTEESDLSSRTGTAEGLIYLQEVEVASTVLAGITARIARRMGAIEERRLNQRSSMGGSAVPNTTKVCTARLMPLRGRKFGGRSAQGSFLWSMVREPVDRLVHKYYHFGTQRPVRRVRGSLLRPKEQGDFLISTSGLQQFTLNNENQDYGYYFRSLAVLNYLNPYAVDSHYQFVQQILESYDFLGVSERMDESLVVLKLLLGLETQDLLYLPTHPKATNSHNTKKDATSAANVATATSYYEQWGKHECRPVREVNVTVEMKEWFHSEEFEAFAQADVLFYKAVNASLDMTIDALGRDTVQRGVKQLQWALAHANEACPNVRYPCSTDGEFQPTTDCIFSDVGCGYKCLDTVAQSLATNRDFQALLE